MKLAVERHSFHRKAWSDHLKLRRMEPTKRREYIRSLIQYEHMDPKGPFKQLDAFDDVNVLFENILDGAVNPPERTSDNVVALNDLAAAR